MSTHNTVFYEEISKIIHPLIIIEYVRVKERVERHISKLQRVEDELYLLISFYEFL